MEVTNFFFKREGSILGHAINYIVLRHCICGNKNIATVKMSTGSASNITLYSNLKMRNDLLMVNVHKMRKLLTMMKLVICRYNISKYG